MPRQMPSMARAFGAALVCAGLGAAVAGCSQTDPYGRPGEWRPLGANATNLRLMVAQPADLVGGHGTSVSDGNLAARAVARLRSGQVKALPASSLSDVKLTDSGAAGGSDSGGAAATPAAAPAAASQ